MPTALWAALPQPANPNCTVVTLWRIFLVTDAETLHPAVVRTPKWRQTGLCHDQPSGVLVLFSKLSIQRDFAIKSCSLIFLVFTSLPQMLDPPEVYPEYFSCTIKGKRTSDCACGTSELSGC